MSDDHGFTMSEKLKPCPFCGHNAEITVGDGQDWYVVCAKKNCHARVPPADYLAFGLEQEAIEAWNHRAVDKARTADVELLREAVIALNIATIEDDIDLANRYRFIRDKIKQHLGG